MTHRASDQNPESSSLPSSLSREETASAAEQEYQAFYNKSGLTGFSLTALAPQTLDHIARDIFMAAWEASETRHREVVALPPHRVCIAQEHDPANGKMHGCCVICAELWPCSTERTRPTREVVETGAVGLIAAERRRQVEREGWSEVHDDTHGEGDLAMAAVSYALPPEQRDGDDVNPPGEWPWVADDWKPGPDRIRELVKAGALIAAEIDRLQRAALASYQQKEKGK